MEKLELKHLQAYKLGENGVKVLLTDWAKLNIAIEENVDLSEKFYISNIDFESETICIIAESGYEIDSIPLGYIKPLLYPLSDIKKVIEHNGEKFVPLYSLIKEDKAFTLDFIECYGVCELKLSVYEKLIEWHFDIFNLIDKNLAIDINTI